MAFIKLLSILFVVTVVNSKQDFSKRLTNFGFELLYFTGRETDAHTVISPLGIWTLMASVAQGTEGNSYEQLSRVLNLPKGRKELLSGYKLLSRDVHTKARGITLLERNFIFTDQNFAVNKDFKQTLKSAFDTAVVSMDFSRSQESAKRVNEVIAKTTDGRIRDALSPDDFYDAQMILTNVIHFKGFWKFPFNVTDTRIEPFYNEDGQEIGQVNMMHQRTPFPFTNMKSLEGFVLEVPYGEDERFSMLIVMPYAGVRLLDMFRKFKSVTLNDIFVALDKDRNDYGEEEVDLSLPRFKIATNVILNKPLIDMGVHDIFEPSSANFNQMTKERVFVSKVVHKADIEVTEIGTVASAVSSSVISNRNPPIDFKANRPFVYLILEKMSSTILFGGVYSKPSVF